MSDEKMDKKTWMDWPFVRMISPTGFIKVAASMLVFFTLFHLLGWREKMTFMSGTMSQDFSSTVDVFMGLLYGGAYMAVVLMLPILLLAAVFFKILSRLFILFQE